MAFSVIGLSGSVRNPSRTSALVRMTLAAIDSRLGTDGHLIQMAEAAPLIFSALTRADAGASAEAIIRSVESADILVVATPVYRASYTGALKHLFDLVSPEALIGKPVVLAATGGSPLHGLVTEHQLRPLLSFFGALTVPCAIYASETDFDGFSLISTPVIERIDRAADEVLRLTAGYHASAGKPASGRQPVAAPL
jgi:FMN reductase